MQGKIIICGFDLTRDADDPVSRQMKASLTELSRLAGVHARGGINAGAD